MNNKRIYNYINDDIKIDFELSKPMENLIRDAENADSVKDYGLYMNLADAIDARAKKEVTHHIIKESNWKQLVRRYQL